jgi:hypothetical protein
VVFQVIKASDLHGKKCRRGQPEFTTHAIPIGGPTSETRRVDAVVHNFYALGRNALVRDQRLAYSFANRDHSIPPPKQDSVCDDSLAPGVVRLMAAMLGKKHTSGSDQASQQGIEEGCILMRVHQIHTLFASPASKPPRAARIEAGSAP